MSTLVKKELYDSVSFETAKLVTTRYSTSFSIGIRLLDPSIRDAVYGIYGFVRLADEIVDTFHSIDQEKALDQFEEDTWKAIQEKISLNPVLHAFQLVVHSYNIDRSYIEAFLASMKMDLRDIHYNDELLRKYIYGSAEVVGLMCLQVYCHDNIALYKELIHPARQLGSAFQKVNFLRDLRADIRELGRSYFPGVDKNTFNDSKRKALIADIEQEFAEGLRGIRHLPNNCRLGVYTAYVYYSALLKKLANSSAETILNSRVRVSNGHKFLLFVTAYIRNKTGFTSGT